jgi:hypothetical protein
MNELDFLINLRRLFMQALSLLDKRIESLRCTEPVNYANCDSVKDGEK